MAIRTSAQRAFEACRKRLAALRLLEVGAKAAAVKRRWEVLILTATALGLAVRFCGRSFLSADMTGFLLPWFGEIGRLGDSALATQVGNYNLPYQTLIYVGTLLPSVNPVYWYKGLSIAFDFVLAAECGLLTCRLTGRRSRAALAYTAVLLAPPVFLDSGFWGQCDSIYGAFVVAALRGALEDRPARSAFLFGVALSFKLQAVFFLPFLIYCYLAKLGFGLRYAAAALPGFYLPCLPAVLLGGRSLADPFSIYLGQAGGYPHMYLNYPSFWVMAGDDYGALRDVAVSLAVAALAVEVCVLLSPAGPRSGPFGLLRACAWMMLTCVYFLPAMHERYGYVATVLLVVAAAASRDPFRCLPPAAICVAVDLMTYSNYLFGASVPLLPMSVALLLAWAWLGWLALAPRGDAAVGFRERMVEDHGHVRRR